MKRRPDDELDPDSAPVVQCHWCSRSTAPYLLGSTYTTAVPDDSYYCDVHCLYTCARRTLEGSTALEGLAYTLKHRFRVDVLVLVDQPPPPPTDDTEQRAMDFD